VPDGATVGTNSPLDSEAGTSAGFAKYRIVVLLLVTWMPSVELYFPTSVLLNIAGAGVTLGPALGAGAGAGVGAGAGAGEPGGSASGGVVGGAA
jgi:hypothetical protein